MNLDKVIVALRPRTNHEAIDLGFVLARRYYWQLLLIWLVGALPVTILSYALLWDHKGWALFVVWWLKPWYERQQLYYLGMRLFDQPITLAEAIKGYWSRDLRNIAWSLTLGRLSISRSFNASVSLLEGLSGKARKQRLKALHRQGNSPELLIFMCSVLEAMIALTPISLSLSMIPPELLQFVDWESLLFYVTNSKWVNLALHLCIVVAMALISVFFTASGFSLYINRRTHLEGWDIELQFRQIAEKARSTIGMLAISVLAGWLALGVVTSPDAMAQSNQLAESTRAQIETVLGDKAFGYTRTVTRWVPNKESQNQPARRQNDNVNIPNLSAGGGFLKFVSLLAIFIAIIAVVLFLARNSHWFGRESLQSRRRKDLPVEVFGLAVDEASLPDDVSSEAMRLIEQGDYRAALSLLYRASLSKLMTRGDLVIDDASTEGECLRQVRGTIDREAEDYFTQLTRGWQRQAYAHESMPIEQLTQLVKRWRGFLSGFSSTASGAAS